MTSLQIVDPDEPYIVDPTVPILIQRLDDPDRRQRAYQVLRRHLRDTDIITLIDASGEYRLATLADLPGAENLSEARIEPVPPELAVRSLAGARSIVSRLRDPGGCPWDREQTPESLIRFVIEEAYEVGEAIRSGAPDDVSEELGDVLLQVLLQSKIAEERAEFTFDDVVEQLSNKLIRRHPHVFGDASASTSGEVERNWEQLKQAEKPKRTSAIDGAGKGLPSLMAAQAVQRRMRSAGFDWPNEDGAWAKLEEEIRELHDASGKDELHHELGDVLFMAARIGIARGIDAETALLDSLARQRRRFQHLETRLAETDRTITDAPFDELRALWDEAKALEHQKGGR